MRDFTYIRNKEKFNLAISDSGWLVDAGLLETHWFLDAKWLMKHTTLKVWLTRGE